MVVTEEEGQMILEALDKLQMEDRLSQGQLSCAWKIMDFYPRLNWEFFYLRDRYNEKQQEKGLAGS